MKGLVRCLRAQSAREALMLTAIALSPQAE